MTIVTAPKKKVFISYAHEAGNPAHTKRVRALGNRLQSEGMEVTLDLDNPHPPVGWPLWIIGQISDSDYVIMVCTPTYYKRFLGLENPAVTEGVRFEAGLILDDLYKNHLTNYRFIPVLYPPNNENCIPAPMGGFAHYHLSDEHLSCDGYLRLYQHLADQREVPGGNGAAPTHSQVSAAIKLPSRNDYFTGRETDLAEIDKELKKQRCVSIHGLSGIGKTQIVTEYANRHKAEFTSVFWVNAASRDSLITGFAAIARQMNLGQQNDQDKEVVVLAVKAWMEQNSGWLLILDNADKHDVVVAFLGGNPDCTGELFPARRDSFLLLTTQLKFQGLFQPLQQIEIHEMPNAQGVEMLLRYADIAQHAKSVAPQEEQAALTLCEELMGHPLALAQAGAFIAETEITPTRYLELYKTEGAKLRDTTLPKSFPISLRTTFTLAFEKMALAKPSSAELIRLCAFLAPDAIPEELFVKGGINLGKALNTVLNQVTSGLDWLGVLATAQQYSLLSRNPRSKTFSLHRLVRDVLKDSMTPKQRIMWSERAVRAVANAFPAVEFEKWTLCDRLLPHALACESNISKYNLQSPEAAKMLHETAYFLSERNQYDRALPLYEQSLRMSEALLSEALINDAYSTAVVDELHVIAAKCLNNLGLLYLNKPKTTTSSNDYKLAESYCRRALIIRRRLHGTMDHHEVAWCLHNLAAIHVAQNKYEDAYLTFRKSVFIYESLWKQLGNSEPLKYCNIAFSLEGLAEVCCLRAIQNAGDNGFRQACFQEAEAHYLRSDEIRNQHYPSPPGHPHLALSYIGLAMLYHQRSDYQKAISQLETAIAILEKVVPFLDNDPHLRSQRETLLRWYQDNGHGLKATQLQAIINMG